jgi:hypothetical protein
MRMPNLLLLLGGLALLVGCEADAQRGDPPFEPGEADALFMMESKPVEDPSTDPYRAEPQWLIEIPVGPAPEDLRRD